MSLTLISLQKHYEYTKLADCSETSDSTYNFYAVIVDATFPHKSFKSDKFICNLKVIDSSLPVDKDGVV